MGSAGNLAFKAVTGGLVIATFYLGGGFAFNVYKGLAWHKAQSKIEDRPEDPKQ